MIALAEVLGFFLLLPACLLHAWTGPTYTSTKPLTVRITENGKKVIVYRDRVDQWSWQWLNKWYANVEDGVSGQQAFVWNPNGDGTLVPYASTFPRWTPQWVIAYGWSAWRNGANNIKRPLRKDSWT